jgi:hypothetical protein
MCDLFLARNQSVVMSGISSKENPRAIRGGAREYVDVSSDVPYNTDLSGHMF